jgi:hypothetical protein
MNTHILGFSLCPFPREREEKSVHRSSHRNRVLFLTGSGSALAGPIADGPEVSTPMAETG